MKPLHTILSVFILLIYAENTAQIAQINESAGLYDIMMLDNLNRLSGRANGNTIDIEKISGSPYLNPEFTRGTLVNTMEGDTLDVRVRYNVFSDNFQIQFENNDIEVAVIERSTRYKISLLGKEFVFVQHPKLFENTNLGYVAKLTADDEPYTLYKSYTAIYTPEEIPSSSYDTGSPARVTVNSKFYLRDNSANEYQELDDHRRRVLDAFSDKDADKIKSFMKKNDYKLRGSDYEVEQEMIAIINYYNELK